MVSFGFYADMDGMTFDELKETSVEAERLGYDSFWLLDHLHSFPAPDRQPILESWTTLSALTMATKKIRIGILVTNIQNRLPSLLAKMAATVDVISNGRLEMGVGAGGTGRSSIHQKTKAGRSSSDHEIDVDEGTCNFQRKILRCKGRDLQPTPHTKTTPSNLDSRSGRKIPTECSSEIR